MRVAIASGKGGTGKTLVATNLAAVAKGSLLVDLDVEEPNCYLFYKAVTNTSTELCRPVPKIDMAKCTLCGNCAKVCEFHAIAVLPREVMVFEELCHSCGACSMFCPESAITECAHPVGEILEVTSEGQDLLYGRLRIGEAAPVPLIRGVKAMIPTDGLAIIDCPPGAACSMVESVRGSDIVVLVTEPTPFGLHDLKLALSAVKKMRLRHAVMINKQGLEGPDIKAFCCDKGIDVVGELPYGRSIAEAYSDGRLLVSQAEYQSRFRSILDCIIEAAGAVR